MYAVERQSRALINATILDEEKTMSRNYSVASAMVFALAALTHAWSFVLDLPTHMGAWSVTRPVTGLLAIAAALMAVWGLRSAHLGKTARIEYSDPGPT